MALELIQQLKSADEAAEEDQLRKAIRNKTIAMLKSVAPVLLMHQQTKIIAGSERPEPESGAIEMRAGTS